MGPPMRKAGDVAVQRPELLPHCDGQCVIIKQAFNARTVIQSSSHRMAANGKSMRRGDSYHGDSLKAAQVLELRQHKFIVIFGAHSLLHTGQVDSSRDFAPTPAVAAIIAATDGGDSARHNRRFKQFLR
jgi:hypothetical protein